MDSFLITAAAIIVGGVGLTILAGILWVIRQMHGLLYKATNGDEESVTFMIKELLHTQQDTLEAIVDHHSWAKSVEKDKK